MREKELRFLIKALNNMFDKYIKEKKPLSVDEQDMQEFLEEQGIESRICSNCDHLMIEGYIVDEGNEYFCSDKCMKEFYSEEELAELLEGADEDDTSIYWTDWI